MSTHSYKVTYTHDKSTTPSTIDIQANSEHEAKEKLKSGRATLKNIKVISCVKL